MPNFDLWRLDPYRLARPLLFRCDAEKAHGIALSLLKAGLGPKDKNDDPALLHTTVCGLDFRNPIGLAAGFDKNAEVVDAVLGFGFGFAEIGTITPRPQAGNPQPRLFRAPAARAVINRLGFNSDGMDACLWRIKTWYDARQRPEERSFARGKKTLRGRVGINIGKNRDSADASADYVAGLVKLAPYADYATINISSPNTPGLRELQGREQLGALLQKVMTVRTERKLALPLFVKIAPDLTEPQMEDVAAVTLATGIHGLVIGNTTLSRPENLPEAFAREAGGLSGKPLFDLSTKVLADMYRLTQGKIPLIGAGGVFSGADAYAKIRAGASLVQLYSALVYEGPRLIPRIKRDLVALLKRDGFKSVSEAVGVDNPLPLAGEGGTD